MAAKKSTAETRSRRNLPLSSSTPAFNLESLRAHIEAERSRLTDAEAVLDCIIDAMEQDERLDKEGPRYPNVVRIARSFVSATIDRLDSIYIRSALEQGSAHVAPAEGSGNQEHVFRKCRGVQESSAFYVH